MTNFVPLIYLEAIIFPLQKIDILFTQQKDIDLLTACFAQNKNFGFSFRIDGKNRDTGVSARIMAISHEQKGSLATIQAIQLITILERVAVLPDKLFGGAIVSYPLNKNVRNHTILLSIITLLRKQQPGFTMEDYVNKPVLEILSYDLVPVIDLPIQEQYELLQLTQEDQRLAYLKRYLETSGNDNSRGFKNFKGFSLS